MAYIGNTARLCQSIVDCAADEVKEQLAQDGANPNKRDYTGRAPLHLAALCSTPDVVRVLVEGGARLTARLLDGRTALHIAAARGDSEILKILLNKSNENEEADAEKQDLRRRAKKSGSEPQASVAGSQTASSVNDNVQMEEGTKTEPDTAGDNDPAEIDEDDGELIEAQSTTDNMSIATGSFVKVNSAAGQEAAPLDDADLDGSDDEPDFYKIDTLAWDMPCSPLHLAIVNGHEEAVKVLCDVSWHDDGQERAQVRQLTLFH